LCGIGVPIKPFTLQGEKDITFPNCSCVCGESLIIVDEDVVEFLDRHRN